MTIHPGWLISSNAKHRPHPGVEPRQCHACRNSFMPIEPEQDYCDTPSCRRKRDRRREQERRDLARMLKKADDRQRYKRGE